MHPSTAISAPSQASAPSAPRAQKSNNRKSGLTAALQKQSQGQSHQSQPQSQTRHNNNGSRHAQKTPEQTHHRHHSMPPQQRNNGNSQQTKADMTNVTILKRSSAAPVAKTVTVLDPQQQVTSKRTQTHQHQHQHQHQQRNHHPNQKQRPHSQQPSKARRVQRRQEAQVDLEQAMQQSPPLDPSSPPSSSDSDDSESFSRLPDNYLRRQLTGSPPHRPSSAPAVPQQAQPRRGHQNMDGAQHGSSRGPYPMDMPQRPTVTIKTNSADKVMLMEKKTSLYAGPTFHNSPAPTSLPIPAFSRSAGNSPTEPTVDRLPSSPFFAEAASPQLNSMRPFTVPSPTEGWTGHYSMPLTHGYNVPDRMATSSFTPHGPAPDSVAHLMEISQSLRNLLKIQSQ